MTSRFSAGSWGVFLCGLSLWWLATHSGWVSRAFLPTPEAALQSLWRGLIHGDLARQSLETVLRMTGGWLIGGAMGVALGALIGMSDRARRWSGPTLEFCRPLPASAVLPLGTALFGLSSSMVLGVVALGAMWPVLLATLQGMASVPAALRDVAQGLSLGRGAYLRKIALPHALPDIVAGLQLALAVALIVSVVGEMTVTQNGLGQTIVTAPRAYQSSELMAGILLLSGVGVASNALLGAARRRLLRGRPTR